MMQAQICVKFRVMMWSFLLLHQLSGGYSQGSSTTDSKKDSSDDVPIALIAGPIAGGVALIVLIVACVFLWRRCKQSKREDSQGFWEYGSMKRIISRHEINPAFSEIESNAPEEQNPSLEKSAPVRPLGAIRPTEQAVSTEPSTSAKARNSGVKPKLPEKEFIELKTKEKETKAANKKKGRAYYNTVSAVSSTAVAVANLDMFMASHSKDFFKAQFDIIPVNPKATTKIGQSDKNRLKNRYKNILAYDHSRVHLQINKGKKLGDYINASYVEGYKEEEKFIASQGPTTNTMEDFVRMLWEQRVEKVVMLTNLIEQGKTKCERYWPEDDVMEVGDITVALTTTQVFADYTIRRLQLKTAGKPLQELTQFHFTSWPDKNVPETPWGLVDFEQRVTCYPSNRPIVVHCSAGVGRTGTFIALRNVMREAEDTGYVDFFTTVQKLRKDRMSMVQTAVQYEFLHRAAQVAIVCMRTTVTGSDIQARIALLETKTGSGQSNMEKEFKAVCDMCDDSEETVDEDGSGENVHNVYQNSRTLANKLKNRLPKEYYRIRLMKETNDLGDYINAVFVPSFSKQDHQILTQLPMPMTVIDFWRLVTQYKVSFIVAFEQDLGATDMTIGDYLPSNENETLSLSLLKVKSDSVTRGEFCERQKLVITASAEIRSIPNALEGERRVTHLKCTTTNLDPQTLLTLIRQIRSLNPAGEGRTLYMCRNGADYSGLVCVLSLLLDRMDNDQQLTVPLVVGAIKAIRPQVIPTLDQYRLLYQALKLYSETSSVYCNFGNASATISRLGASMNSNTEV